MTTHATDPATTPEPGLNTPRDVVPSKALRRTVTSSVIGSAVEWYDFLVYATASALVFDKVFFPSFDPALGTLAAFGSYAVGFLARPLGAAIFGHYGDKLGRKAMLTITILLMGFGTFAIGLLPSYAQIGIAAPIMLVVLRLLQGIGIGGEWAGAVLMVVETAPTERRGFYGTLVQIGNPVGNIGALAIFAAVSQLPDEQFLSWGWRIPFLLSILLVGVGLFIRFKLEETPEFRRVQREDTVARMPIVEVLTKHRRTFAIAVGLKICEIAYASIGTTFVIAYATSALGVSRESVLNGPLLAYIAALFAIPVFGAMSDRFGRRAMFVGSGIFCATFAFPMFALLGTRVPVVIIVTIMVAILFGQMVMFAVGAPWYAELFDARLRYSGASLGFQVGAAISGGFTPLIASSLLLWSGGSTWPVSVFLIGCAALTLWAAMQAPETARKELT